MKIDVIIPCYNVEAYVGRCLESLQAQTFSDWRAICVDDGSRDGTLSVLREYAAADSRITVVPLDNGGVSRARNTALDMVEAEYVYFLDSDDFIHPQTFEIALWLMERDGSDIVTFYRKSSYRNIWVRLRRALGLDTIDWKPLGLKHRYRKECIRSYRTEDLLMHCTSARNTRIKWPVKQCYIMLRFYRREVVSGIRQIEGMYFEDIPWWSEVVLEKRTATITELPLYYYYPSPISIVRSTDKVQKELFIFDGLLYAWKLYRERTVPERWEHWRKEYAKPLLERSLKRCSKLDSEVVRDKIKEVRESGLL